VPFVYISFKPNELVSGDFFFFWFENYGLDRQLKKIITSGARGDGLLNVSKKDFFNLQIPAVSKIEQEAIGGIIRTTDNEIKLQEEKLAQLQATKKGLMQQLLTGEVRVN
jgi:type I restriction enzyme S subunit